MAIRKKKNELKRIKASFQSEADKFHDISFSVFYVVGDWVRKRKFHDYSHVISLWQYIGKTGSEEKITQLTNNLYFGRTKYGITGAKFSSYGVIEGEEFSLFLRMAKRAGGLFSENEIHTIQNDSHQNIVDDAEEGKPAFVQNSNTIAIWLNYLLYHLSISHPKRFHETEINIDPFEASLNAIEHLLKEPKLVRSKQKHNNIEKINFKVTLSFPGEWRDYVCEVSKTIKSNIDGEVFYDMDYQAQLARPNLDILLQEIYRNNSDLIVVFLCKEYNDKEWCGLEWRAIRDIIKSRKDKNIMFMRFDDSDVKGTFSIDGYISLKDKSPSEAANFILERLSIIDKKT